MCSTNINFTQALALLLSQQELIDAFANNKRELLQRLSINVGVRKQLEQIEPRHLQAQAKILRRKRLQAVKAQLPGTSKRIGSMFSPLFLDYAEQYWPNGYRKHISDAFHFGLYIQKRRPDLLIEEEYNRIRTIYKQRKLAIYRVKKRNHQGKTKSILQVDIKLAKWPLYSQFFHFGIWQQ